MMAVRVLVLMVLPTLLICPNATGQSACEGRPRPTFASVDAIFMAKVQAVEPDTQVIRVDDTRATWLLVRFLLHPRYGWKLDPRRAAEMWDPDTTGLFSFSIQPKEAPPIQPGTWALVYMRVPVLDIVNTTSDTTRAPQDDLLEAVSCGVRAAPDTALGTRLYGPPSWRSDRR